MKMSFTHCIILGDTIVSQFEAGTDDGAAVIARAFVKRRLAEAKLAGLPLNKEDFRLRSRIFKTKEAVKTKASK